MKLDLPFTSGRALPSHAGAYALIRDAEDRVLLVRAANGRFYLPGGRIEAGETPEEALAREIAEECGWSVRVIEPLGEAFQPILGGGVMLRATYWRAEITGSVDEEPEHQLLWTPRAEAASRVHRPPMLARSCHCPPEKPWAVAPLRPGAPGRDRGGGDFGQQASSNRSADRPAPAA